MDAGVSRLLQQLLLEQETNLVASFQDLLKDQETRINSAVLAAFDERMPAPVPLTAQVAAGRKSFAGQPVASQPLEGPPIPQMHEDDSHPRVLEADEEKKAHQNQRNSMKRSITKQLGLELSAANQDVRRWWYVDEPVFETDTVKEAWAKRSRKFLDSHTFGKALAMLIFVNCVSLGWQVDWGVQNYSMEEPVYFEVIGMLFTLIFLAEFSLRFFAYGLSMFVWPNPDFGWNVFDALLVISSIMDEIMSRTASGINVTALRVLRLARLLRILRVFRVVRYFTDLRVMVHGILMSAKTLIWAIALLFVLMFAVSCCILQLLRPYLSTLQSTTESQELLESFGSMPLGVFTLFSSMSGGVDWAEVAVKLNRVSTLLAVLFCVYMSFALFLRVERDDGCFCGQRQQDDGCR
mmetsp:Transcript_4101/g.9577  ORF Transcript_4101/g.9577 Transcript_4101/m.9577 type:complete len:408 (+) Transcript_4101:50-1273(+)